MYWSIIGSTPRSVRARSKAFFEYARLRRAARIAWGKRFGLVFLNNPEFRRCAPPEAVKAHSAMWKRFRQHPNLSDLQIAFNGNLEADPRVVPEEIFVADIEPTLNKRMDLALLANKSLYYKLYEKDRFPKPFLHLVEGRVYDSSFQVMDSAATEREICKIPFPVLLKPNKDSAGGEGVQVIEDADALRRAMRCNRNLVVQELLRQHSFFERFNSCGLNTVRVNLYRSVKDNSLVFLNCALRMGVGGSLDNETAGGIVVHIEDQGDLSGTARDKYGRTFARHPDSGLEFLERIPFFESLKEISLAVGNQVLYGRLFSLDLCLDETGVWRVIEINMHGQTIRFAQYAGRAFFGDYTEEVVDYCLREHWALSVPVGW